MKKVAVVVLGLFFVLGIAGQALSADKFAYVDLNKVFSDYGKTKDYDKVLTDKENTYSSEREKKVNEIKQFQDKLNLLNENQKAAKKGELEAKVKSLQEYDRQKQTDLRKDQDEKMKEIFKDIDEAIKKYAEKDGLTFVFNDKLLLYQEKKLDITDKILDILNKKR